MFNSLMGTPTVPPPVPPSRLTRRALFAAVLPVAMSDGLRDGGTANDVAMVTILEFSYQPASLAIAVGQRVIWTNADEVPHSVVHAAHPHEFKSRVLFHGERFSHRFETPGRYHYVCGVYRRMQGVIVVA